MLADRPGVLGDRAGVGGPGSAGPAGPAPDPERRHTVEEPGTNGPEQYSQEDEGQRGKADRLVRERVDTRQELGKRAQEGQDPDGGDQDPAGQTGQGAPAKEQ